MEAIIHQSVQAMWMILIISGVPLLITTACGLCIALMQGLTSVQEQSLTFFVKLVVIAAVFYLAGDAMISYLATYCQELLMSLEFFGTLD